MAFPQKLAGVVVDNAHPAEVGAGDHHVPLPIGGIAELNARDGADDLACQLAVGVLAGLPFPDDAGIVVGEGLEIPVAQVQIVYHEAEIDDVGADEFMLRLGVEQNVFRLIVLGFFGGGIGVSLGVGDVRRVGIPLARIGDGVLPAGEEPEGQNETKEKR